jgi:uncharacterized membrane protein
VSNIKIKRKLIWSKSKCLIQLRISEMMMLGIHPKQKYYFSIVPNVSDKSLIVSFTKNRTR